MKKKDGFQELKELKEAKDEFIESINSSLDEESLEIEKAHDRVLSRDLVSPKPIPNYNKAAMDGYAVKASDTFGAKNSSPIVLDLNKSVNESGAKRVHTGSAVPSEADAVVKIEDVEKSMDKLEVFKAVSPGENVDFVGEDIEEGEVVFEKNHVLRAFDIGLLRSLGVKDVFVYEKPKVLVIPTGDEVVSPTEEPQEGEVIESNSLVIKLVCEKYGAEVDIHSIVRDDKEKILSALDKGRDYDVVICSGGTSVGKRDYTASVVHENGEVFSHGIAIKPGKPTLLGKYKETPLICLPGHPVACFISLNLFLVPLLFKFRNDSFIEKRIKATLDRKIESTVGYRTFTRVKLVNNKAVPVRTSGSGIQSSLTSADGYVVVSEETEGLDKDTEVEVIFFE